MSGHICWQRVLELSSSRANEEICIDRNFRYIFYVYFSYTYLRNLKMQSKRKSTEK